MLKLAEAYMTKTREEFPEKYFDELPSLCRHLTEMILSERYVFSADFLARGYRFDRLSAEKMWRMTCCPEQTNFQDVAQAVFTGNPDCLNVQEEQGIWTSQPTTEIQSFPYTVDVSRTANKRKNNIRSPSNPEVQTGPLNFENIRKRLDDLKITREDRERLRKHEFSSDSDSDSNNSLSL
jgi:hypothetical protein